jgi:hypothetical protein
VHHDLNNMRERLQGNLAKIYCRSLKIPRDWNSWSELGKYEYLRRQEIFLWYRKKYSTVGFYILFCIRFFRARVMMNVFEASMRANIESRQTMLIVKSREFYEVLQQYFCSYRSFWVYPFRSKIKKWYEKTIEALERELL